jgi:hypothetical protein
VIDQREEVPREKEPQNVSKICNFPFLGYQVNNVWIPKEKRKRKESKQPDNQGLQIFSTKKHQSSMDFSLMNV